MCFSWQRCKELLNVDGANASLTGNQEFVCVCVYMFTIYVCLCVLIVLMSKYLQVCIGVCI